MAFDFATSCEVFSVYASKADSNQFALSAAAICSESYEERACTLFEVPGWGRNPSFEWKGFQWL
jgi:hypothetical protein